MYMSENAIVVQNTKVPELFGLMAEYPNVDSLLAAARRVQAEGYTSWDCHTPFPVHGLDKVMKIKPTILPWLSLGGALTGVFIGLVLPLLVNGIAYPLNFSGKPYWGLPANVPVAFPLFILFGVFSTVVGFSLLCGLPKLYHPLFTVKRFKRATDDGLFLVIEAADPRFDVIGTRQLLESLGAVALDEVKD